MKRDLKDFFKEHWLMLAPMAGVNDPVFRQLCIENGAMLTYTEMVSSKALSYNNPKTNNLLELAPNEKQVVVQIFGHEPDTMAAEAKNVEEKLGGKLAYIDINMGCPARKITKKGDGAALLRNIELAQEIVSSCNDACDSAITVKFRKGFTEDEDISLEFAKAMQEAGASAVCIHGRTAQQFYKGIADVEAGAKIASELDIPVIWSGDIASRSEANEVIKKYGFAATMIARAARGNPSVFSEAKNGDALKRVEDARKHVSLYAEKYPSTLTHMRKHCMWYCHGLPGATFARDKFSKCSTLDEYVKVLDELTERLEK